MYLEVHDRTVKAGRTPVPALHTQLTVKHVHVIVVAKELCKTLFFLEKGLEIVSFHKGQNINSILNWRKVEKRQT